MKKFLIGLVVALLLLFAVAEGGVRWFISNQLKSEHGEAASISFGFSPVVTSLVTGKVGQVDMSLPSTLSIEYPDGAHAAPTINGSPASQVQIRDLSIKDPNNQTAGSLVLDTKLSDEFMLAQVQDSMAKQGETQDYAAAVIQSLVRVSNITSNAAEGTVVVEFTDGAASLTLRPSAVAGQLQFEAEKASLFGFDLPPELSAAITDSLRDSAGTMAGGLQVDSIAVEDGGIALQLSGTDVNFNEVGVVSGAG